MPHRPVHPLSHLLENVVGATLVTDLEKHAFVHQVHQVQAQGLGTDGRAKFPILPVGDASLLLEVGRL